MLSELGDGQSKCYCYWPKTEQVFDYVKIIPESEQELDNYMIRKFYVVNTKVGGQSGVSESKKLRIQIKPISC